MKSLVVFYLRTGTTRTVAEAVSERLGSDVDEIHDTRDRRGFIGWMSAGRDAGKRKLTTIKDVTKDPGQYDLVVIGTPVWNNTVSTPIRTYIAQHRDRLNEVAFFCTQDTEKSRVFEEEELLVGRKPVATLALRKKADVEEEDYEKLVMGLLSVCRNKLFC